jgi:hypothetical protein
MTAIARIAADLDDVAGLDADAVIAAAQPIAAAAAPIAMPHHGPAPVPLRLHLSEDDYYLDYSAYSRSMLEDFRDNPPEFEARYIRGVLPPKPSTREMEFGKAFHAANLEPATFNARYCPARKIDRRTKLGKAAFADFQLEHAGKTILTAQEAGLLATMTASLSTNRIARRWLFGRRTGEAEKVIRWTCPATGLPRKAKLDWVDPIARVIIDLKSAEDASDEAFQRAAVMYGFHRQVATYTEAATAHYGTGGWTFHFVVTDKRPWPRTRDYRLCHKAVALGAAQNRQTLAALKACLATGDFSEAPSDDLAEIDLPNWHYTQTQTERSWSARALIRTQTQPEPNEEPFDSQPVEEPF